MADRDDGREFFRWKYWNPVTSACECDCLARSAAFEAGVAYGKELMLHASAEWTQLTPLLGAVLEELVSMNERHAVEHDIVESDMRPAF